MTHCNTNNFITKPLICRENRRSITISDRNTGIIIRPWGSNIGYWVKDYSTGLSIQIDPDLFRHIDFEMNNALFQFVPESVRSVVMEFRKEHQWDMLKFLNQYPESQELGLLNPFLLYLIAHSRKVRDFDTNIISEIVRKKQYEILGFLGLPNDKWFAKILRKIPAYSVTIPLLKSIITLTRTTRGKKFWLHFRTVSLPSYFYHLVTIIRSPELLSDMYRLLIRDPMQDDRPTMHFEMLYKKARDLACSNNRQTEFRRLSTVKQLTDFYLNSKPSILNRYHIARPEGTKHIIELITAQSIRAEGRKMRNCLQNESQIVKAMEEIRYGDIALYKVMHPERCTLELTNSYGNWEISDILGVNNTRPKLKETIRDIEEWLRPVADDD